MREIILDTETTGLDPKTGDRLVEIGAVEMINLFTTGKFYHQYINPDRSMPREAFEVHGLSDEFLADKPRFEDIADKFMEFIADARLVIHNASFDMGFINAELRKVGRKPIPDDRVLDTLSLARRKFPGSPASLDALCARFGIDNGHRTKHGALLDSELLAEVYVELMGGKQANLGLTDSDGNASGPAVDLTRIRPRPTPRPVLITDAERQAHAAFIDAMGDKAIWKKYGE